MSYESQCHLMGLPLHLNFPQFIRDGALAFKNIENKQCCRINSMPRSELFQFVKNITTRSLERFGLCFYYCSAYPTSHRSNPHELADTIKAILMCIKSRLEGTTYTV